MQCNTKCNTKVLRILRGCDATSKNTPKNGDLIIQIPCNEGQNAVNAGERK